MIHRFMLPDSLVTLLTILALIAVVVYIKETLDDIKAFQFEKSMHEFNRTAENNRIHTTLAGYYTAAADGDPYDCDYWSETAEMFVGGSDER